MITLQLTTHQLAHLRYLVSKNQETTRSLLLKLELENAAEDTTAERREQLANLIGWLEEETAMQIELLAALR